LGRVLEVGGMMNLRHISLLQIDSFLAVCKHLNFTEAAKSLYISQPSLSKQIAAFENEIGVQLFLRNKRAVRLTAAGAVLFKELGDITQQISDAIEKAREPNLGQEGTLVIGCLNGMDTDRFLPKILEDFTANHPKVNLIFERHSFKDLRERLLSGAIDIMFTLSFEMDETLDLEWEELYSTNTEIFMSRKHPLAQRTSIALEDLKEEKFVSISRETSPKGYESVVQLCEKHGFTPNIVKQLPNPESVLLCIEAGLGVFIFESTIKIPNEQNIKRFPIKDDILSTVAAWKKENYNPAISLFVENIPNFT
jgi:DNA-binding transcriptional LysR family regulator